MARIDARRLEKLVRPYRVASGKGFRLEDRDPADTGGLGSERRREAQELLARGVAWLAAEQEKLWAQDRWALLLLFQAMDAAGKDGTIKHVMSGVNPQGVQVTSFKAPSPEELDHDFLWRCARALPERGRIGIFNRSYYEEVLVVRVHEELLARQRLPPELVTGRLWKERFEDIVAFERHLARSGTRVLKFFLHVSPEEQRRRFLERLEEPDKHWKFSAADVGERRHWGAYMAAYEDMIRSTATEEAPWYVVPADHKWFTRLAVAAAVVEAMERLDLAFPRVGPEARRELEAARRALEGEGR
jgi:PPK2 family polyphosphate:nucleotide phosphotransferase